MAEKAAVPSAFGKYELTARLARGGMAETFRAQLKGAAGVTKQVVIKKVLPHLAQDEAFTTAFINEAKISASLSHGNIAQVFDFGRVEGDYFIAMELVDGQSLAQLLARAGTMGFAKLPIPIACFLAMEVLKGLHYAHTRIGEDGQPLSLVHRDISPENVLVSYEGQTKVVDFGVAKAVLRGRTETEPGLVKGKFLYFSPEQALAEPLDARSDVFAMGTVLYRMLCGVLPFKGQMHNVMRAIVAGDFLPAAVVNPAVPSALAAVLAKAMAVERTQRYASALEMQEAIASFLYRQEPTFSGETVKEFMIWLFSPELEADRRSVALSARFQKQLEKWDPRTQATSPAVLALTREAQGVQRKPRGPLTMWIASAIALIVTGVGIGAISSFESDPVLVDHVLPPMANVPGKRGLPTAPSELTPEDQNRVTERTLAVARAAIEGLDWTTAEQVLKICFVGESPCPEATVLLSQMNQERGQLLALKNAERALDEKDLDRAKAELEFVATSRLLSKRFKAARARLIADTERALLGRPPGSQADQAAAYLEEARRFFKEKQYPAAKRQLDLCLKLDPKNFDCHKLMGSVWARLEQPDKGLREYKEFLRLAPSDHPDLDRVKQIVSQFEGPPR